MTTFTSILSALVICVVIAASGLAEDQSSEVESKIEKFCREWIDATPNAAREIEAKLLNVSKTLPAAKEFLIKQLLSPKNDDSARDCAIMLMACGFDDEQIALVLYGIANDQKWNEQRRKHATELLQRFIQTNISTLLLVDLCINGGYSSIEVRNAAQLRILGLPFSKIRLMYAVYSSNPLAFSRIAGEIESRLIEKALLKQEDAFGFQPRAPAKLENHLRLQQWWLSNGARALENIER